MTPQAPPSGPWTALVLAGQRPGGDPLLAGRPEGHKALIPVAGRAMLERVVLALVEAPEVGPVAVCTEDPALVTGLAALRPLVEGGRLVVLASAATPSTSVGGALEQLTDPFPLLVTTADHALLTPTMVSSFCQAALAGGGDVAAGLTTSGAIDAVAPGSRRTWLTFRDGRFTGANLFALMTPRAAEAVSFWRRVERDRKKPWRIAWHFGVARLLGYLLRLWTLEAAIARIGVPLGATARAVVLADGRAGIDVDKPADLALVEKLLAGGP